MLESISKADNLLYLVLSVFATYRIAQFVVYDDAPFALMKRAKAWLGKKAAGARKYRIWWSLAELVNCPYCVGLWIALIIAVVLFPNHIFLYWLAIAGGQSFLENLTHTRGE